MKILFNSLKTILLTSFLVCLVGCHSSSNEKRIGIIVPIEHKAMDEIVGGFKETLRAEYPHPITFKVANAQSDVNMERAIIQQMKDEKFDIVVPIGTDATQMSAAAIHDLPLVSLAATFTQKERDQLKTCNIAVVDDEISSERLMQFMHLVYPQMTQLVLVHSAADKVFPEVKDTIAAAKRYGIEVKPMMVTTLNELYAVSKNIPDNTQGIFILKDNLIASGISTLVLTAQQRHIPLITSDEGTVQEGALFALGVHERQIGVDGAKLAAAVLSGKHPCDLPIVDMTHLTVFVNKAALQKQNMSLDTIQAAAQQQHYTVEFVTKDGGKS